MEEDRNSPLQEDEEIEDTEMKEMGDESDADPEKEDILDDLGEEGGSDKLEADQGNKMNNEEEEEMEGEEEGKEEKAEEEDKSDNESIQLLTPTDDSHEGEVSDEVKNTPEETTTDKNQVSAL